MNTDTAKPWPASLATVPIFACFTRSTHILRCSLDRVV